MLKAIIKKHTKKILPFTFGTVDSTNNIARRMAKSGAKEGVAVIANRQTAGRGRMGRTFLSEKGGVYLSLILRPDLSPADTLFITVAAAVAAARAIESIANKKCEIKWVNDVYIDGKKVCGILTEGEIGNDKGLKFAILGVGINLFSPKGDFPAELPLADSVFEKNCRIFNKKRVKARIIAEFSNEFFMLYENLHKKDFIKEYRQRSFLTGKEITYTKEGKTQIAEVIGIDDNAALVVKYKDEVFTLSYGEIQIVGMEQPAI